MVCFLVIFGNFTQFGVEIWDSELLSQKRLRIPLRERHQAIESYGWTNLAAALLVACAQGTSCILLD